MSTNAIAAFQRRYESTSLIVVHFFKNVAIAGGLLQVVAFGAGEFSVDAHRRGNK